MRSSRHHPAGPCLPRCLTEATLLGCLVVIFAGCTPASGSTWTDEERAIIRSLALERLGPLPESPDNAFADDPATAELGYRLFFDRRLSADGQIACASCHDPNYWFTERSPTAQGLRPLARRTPGLVGAAWLPFLNWDGSKDSLWSQALAPLSSDAEHGLSREAVTAVVTAHHREPYEATFGSPPEDLRSQETIDTVFMNVGRALEAYLRQLRPEPSPFDRFAQALEAGDPEGGGHLDPAALRGLTAFIGPAQCIHCHNGPLFTNRHFHNLGLPPVPGVPDDDPGRAGALARLRADPFRCGGPYSDTSDCPKIRFLQDARPELEGAFKTPSLRNVSARAPYMHAGQLESLAAVLTFYRTLPGEPATGSRDPLLFHIDRRFDPNDMVAFLESLEGAPPPAHWREAPSGIPSPP